jgi:thiamine-phosphate pyrophosphorylase
MSRHDCQLYLIAPDPLPDEFATALQAALAAGDVAALRLTARDRDLVMPVLPITRAHGTALILDGPPALAAVAGCDGAHVTDVDDVPAARRALGDLQLGVFCGGSRDAAMRAGESGADYVAFDAISDGAACNTDVIQWWAELMELPVVAEGAITAANCAHLVRAGADFLAVRDAVWNDPRGPAAGVRALLAAMAEA